MRISDWSSDVCSSDLSALSRASHCLEGRKPMKLAVSLAALAVVLMTSSALAKDPKTDSSTTNEKPTAANAAAFIARAEKELFDYSVDASRTEERRVGKEGV